MESKIWQFKWCFCEGGIRDEIYIKIDKREKSMSKILPQEPNYRSRSFETNPWIFITKEDAVYNQRHRTQGGLSVAKAETLQHKKICYWYKSDILESKSFIYTEGGLDALSQVASVSNWRSDMWKPTSRGIHVSWDLMVKRLTFTKKRTMLSLIENICLGIAVVSQPLQFKSQFQGEI